MSSATPSIPHTPIPETTVISTTTTTTVPAADPQAPITTPAFRAFINNISETVRHGLSHRRPWMELADRSAFSKPESVSEAALRIRKNYAYFKINYMSAVVSILAFSLLTHPFSFFMLSALLASWLFLYVFRSPDQPVFLFGRTYSERETLGILIISSVVVIFLTSVGSVLISGLMLGAGLVCAHGAFRSPDDLFIDEQESAPTGFLYLLGGAASSTANAAAPSVSRV